MTGYIIITRDETRFVGQVAYCIPEVFKSEKAAQKFIDFLSTPEMVAEIVPVTLAKVSA